MSATATLKNTAAEASLKSDSGRRKVDRAGEGRGPRTLKPDVCVIGAGSGGLSVAAACASFGTEVVLIEKGEMGGDCLNYGCVPSKAMIAAGKQAHAAKGASAFGVTLGEPEVDWKGVHDHVHEVQATIAPMDGQPRFEAMGVTVLRDAGRFTDASTVQAGDVTVKARRYVVATGSAPMVPPIEGLDTVDYHTNETIFEREEAPGRLIVIGGGPIGMELAQAHHRLGAEVTVIEAQKALGKDDPELARIVVENIQTEGVRVLESAKVVRVEKVETGIRVHLEGEGVPATVEGDTLLVAVGRKANTDGLGLEEAGIETTKRGIKVSRKLRTTNKRVYAIGDVADPADANGEHHGGLQFTHVAGYHAGLVVRALLFRLPAAEDRTIIPWATYTEPALAHVGLTEAQAKEKGEVRVLRWPLAENDRAIAERKTVGLLKMVTDKKGRILGVTIAGHNAGEMINTWALAVSQKLTVKQVAGYVAPYPIMGEIGKRAATSFYQPMTKKPLTRKAVDLLRMFG